MRPVGDTNGVDAAGTHSGGGGDALVMSTCTNDGVDAQVARARTNGGGDILVVSSCTSCCDTLVVSALAGG